MNDKLNKALIELKYIKKDEKFELKDLFKGYEWKRISRGEKFSMTLCFFNYIVNNPELGIKVTENKVPRSKTIYIKTTYE